MLRFVETQTFSNFRINLTNKYSNKQVSISRNMFSKKILSLLNIQKSYNYPHYLVGKVNMIM